ncbi:hypothetical protein STENM327S_03074 [Streptomyces tendae]
MTTTSSASGSTPPAGRSRPFFWEEAADDWRSAYEEGRRPEFSEYVARSLRALREGVGREAGTVPAMRSVHRVSLRDDGSDRLPDRYVAEHCTLTLFGLHQHTASEPVHRPGVGLGTACLLLRRSEALTEAAVERRLIAAATAQDLHELVQHLQRLVPLLQQAGVGLDYTRLFRELTAWHGPDRDRVLRAWGLQYTDPGTPAPAEGQAEGQADEETDGQERAPYWVTFEPGSPDAGAELAALRSGTGREPGTVASMWPFHRTRMASEWRNKGSLTRDLAAEHTALTLFARHQQTHDRRMHVTGNSPQHRHRAARPEGGHGQQAAPRRHRRHWSGASAIYSPPPTPTNSPCTCGPSPRCLNRAGRRTRLRPAPAPLLRTWDDPRRPHADDRFRQRWDRDCRHHQRRVRLDTSPGTAPATAHRRRPAAPPTPGRRLRPRARPSGAEGPGARVHAKKPSATPSSRSRPRPAAPARRTGPVSRGLHSDSPLKEAVGRTVPWQAGSHHRRQVRGPPCPWKPPLRTRPATRSPVDVPDTYDLKTGTRFVRRDVRHLWVTIPSGSNRPETETASAGQPDHDPFALLGW